MGRATKAGKLILGGVAFAATAALAADPATRGGGDAGSRYEQGGAHGGPGLKAAEAAGASAGVQHEMTGTVTDVDRSRGTVSLTAEGKALTLHFPQTALRDLDKGDRVTVSLGIRQAGGGTASSPRGSAETSGTPAGGVPERTGAGAPNRPAGAGSGAEGPTMGAPGATGGAGATSGSSR